MTNLDSPTKSESSYVPAFDGLRTLSIFGVILFHVVSTKCGLLQNIARRGWFGVDIFFVLSGFLITWLLLAEIDREGTIRLNRFYIRRALRLQPAYFSALILMLLARYLFDRPGFVLIYDALPYYLSYTFNLAIAFGTITVPSFVLAWTLCIEEQFYVCWPWCLRKVSAKRALLSVTIAILVIGAYRTSLYLWLNRGHFWDPSITSWMRINWSTDTHIDTILIGCVLALALRSKRLHTLREKLAVSRCFPTLSVLFAGIVAWIVTGRPWLYLTAGSTIAALSVGAVVVALFLQRDSWSSRLLSLPPLVFVGKLSYGVYLFHLLVWNGVAFTMGLRGIIEGSLIIEFFAVSLVCGISVLVAWIHYNLVEVRFLSLRERFEFEPEKAARTLLPID
jgi:peptidoglycan/LPS O-acetylase OafA/YrhL